MKRGVWIGLWFSAVRWLPALAALGWVAASAAQDAPPAAQSVKLPNGLRVLLAPDSMAAAVDVAVCYRAGTLKELAGTTGITHLMERWMFRGSPHYGPGEHRRLVRAEGGIANTFTTPDASCFYETVPAEALELALKLEADRMGTLALTAEGLERERRAVHEETRQLARESPLGRGLLLLYATVFPGHPYGWPVTGRESDLDRITLAECEAFQKANYAPDNAVLTLTGRFDPVQALALVRRHFGALASHAAAAKPPALPEQTSERRASARIEGEIPVLFVGWRAPGGGDRSSVALDVLSRLLATGSQSRLRQELLRSPAACLAVEGGFDARREASLLYATAIVRPDADSADVENRLLAESHKLAFLAADGPEVDRAKRETELALMMSWETVRARGQSLGIAAAAFGDSRLLEEQLRSLRELTPDDIQRIAAEVLKPERRSVVWLVPGAAGKGAAR
ncbi:MAG TPA: pitrilysin family protein [Candidatus Eisenbacteria bacterium]|jgi:predicted Zn-dependent peptidase